MGEPIRVVIRPRGPEPVRTQRDKIHDNGGIQDATGRSIVLDPKHDGRTISLVIPRNERRRNGQDKPQAECWDMTFDAVLNPGTTQQQMYDSSIRDLVEGTLKGVNSTVLAYGQTGSGKTYTIIGGGTRGNRASSYEDRGMAPRALSHVFSSVQNSPPGVSIVVRVSYLEVYKERLYDLLSGETSNITVLPNGEEVRPSIASAAELRHAQALSEAEAMDLLFEGETNRVIASHRLNSNSTRSHCIFTIHVESTTTNTGVGNDSNVPQVDEEYNTNNSSNQIIPVTRVAKINFVDLAGSERTSSTGSSGKVFEESLAINKSLSFLEQVVLALGEKSREHIPYRQSKLTTILEDSLGGNCATLMLACLWPDARHHDQTFATLRFAGRMARVQNKPQVNLRRAPAQVIQQYEQEIKRLRNELALHDQLAGIDASTVARQEFTPRGLSRLREEVDEYIGGSGDASTFAITSLRQMHGIMDCLKSMLLEQRNKGTQQQGIQEEGTQQQGMKQQHKQPTSARSVKSSSSVASSRDSSSSRLRRTPAQSSYRTHEFAASGVSVGSKPQHSESNDEKTRPDKMTSIQNINRVRDSDRRRAETADPTSIQIAKQQNMKESQVQQQRSITADTGTQRKQFTQKRAEDDNVSVNLDEAAFSAWKKTNEGHELVADRREILQTLQEATRKSHHAKTRVNSCKHDMDILLTSLTSHREEHAGLEDDGQTLGGSEGKDHENKDDVQQSRKEAEEVMVQQLREMKRNYKDAFRKFLNAKDEKNYQARVVAQRDDEIAFKFREWQRIQWPQQQQNDPHPNQYQNQNQQQKQNQNQTQQNQTQHRRKMKLVAGEDVSSTTSTPSSARSSRSERQETTQESQECVEVEQHLSAITA